MSEYGGARPMDADERAESKAIQLARAEAKRRYPDGDLEDRRLAHAFQQGSDWERATPTRPTPAPDGVDPGQWANAGPVPLYALLDLWMALGFDSSEFEDWYFEHGYAESHARLLAMVRERPVSTSNARVAYNQRHDGACGCPRCLGADPLSATPPTSIDRRAPVQASGHLSSGTIAWAEHEEAWKVYTVRYPRQSAERIAERGGFGRTELIQFLGHEPTTFKADSNE